MAYPKLEPYSGQLYRVTEAISKIADTLTVGEAKRILAPYGLTVRTFSEYGYRTMFCICESGSEAGEPPEGTEFFDRAAIDIFCRKVKAGEINLDSLIVGE